MVDLIGGRSSAFDYIGPDLPNNPQNGEMWFDTDGGSDGGGEVKVYDGADGAWQATGFTSHGDLTGVTRGAHHPPVDVSTPLTQPSDQSLGLSIGDGLLDSNGTLVADLGNGLGIDSNGQVYVPASAVSQSMLAFDTATQGELDTHAGDTTNPHNVTDDQTGAASALSNHAGDGSAHHAPYSDAKARNAVVNEGSVDYGGGRSVNNYSVPLTFPTDEDVPTEDSFHVWRMETAPFTRQGASVTVGSGYNSTDWTCKMVDASGTTVLDQTVTTGGPYTWDVPAGSEYPVDITLDNPDGFTPVISLSNPLTYPTLNWP